jgi:hypothetical protein
MVAFGAWFYNNLSVSHACPSITVVQFLAELDYDRVRAGGGGQQECLDSILYQFHHLTLQAV